MKKHLGTLVFFVIGVIFSLFAVFAIAVGVTGLFMRLDNALLCVISYSIVLVMGLLVCLTAKECYDMEKKAGE